MRNTRALGRHEVERAVNAALAKGEAGLSIASDLPTRTG